MIGDLFVIDSKSIKCHAVWHAWLFTAPMHFSYSKSYEMLNFPLTSIKLQKFIAIIEKFCGSGLVSTFKRESRNVSVVWNFSNESQYRISILNYTGLTFDRFRDKIAFGMNLIIRFYNHCILRCQLSLNRDQSPRTLTASHECFL